MKRRGPNLWALSILVLGWALLAGANLGAQAGNGTLTATIVDRPGRRAPGATVTVTEQATNATRTIVTDPDGVFRIPPAGAVQHRDHDGRVLAPQGDRHLAGAG